MTTPNGQQPPQMPRPSIEHLAAEFTRLANENKAGFENLTREGIRFEPLAMVHARIDSLIYSVAAILGPQDGPAWALMARIAFEEKVAENIATAGEQGRKAQLAQGAQFTPGMISQMAREMGLFGKKPPDGHL